MDSPSDAQLARLVVRTLSAVVLLTLAGGIASAAGRLNEGGDDRGSDVLITGIGASRPRGGLGPLPRTSVATYVRVAASDLAALEGGRRAAVVSFARYRTPEQAAALVDDTDVVSWLVALPGGRAQELATDRDLAAWTKGQRDEAAAEKKALEQLLPTVEDPDFRRQYSADIAHLAALLAVGSDRRDVVFGALVVGSARALRSLGARSDIRMVDLAADATPPQSTTFVGIRPEETVEAGDPPTRPTD